jgi:hypothetical protein
MRITKDLSRCSRAAARLFVDYDLQGFNECSSVEVHRRFGGTCGLHLQGRRVSQARNQQDAGGKKSWFLAWLTLLSWRWRRYFPLKRGWTSPDLHSIITQKTILFIVTAVRTSNPTTCRYNCSV